MFIVLISPLSHKYYKTHVWLRKQVCNKEFNNRVYVWPSIYKAVGMDIRGYEEGESEFPEE